MKKTIEVSQQDKEHLEIIRNSVSSFIKTCAENYDNEQHILLDVAPQDHKGAKEFFNKITIKTLDIDPDSSADYIMDLCANNSDKISDDYFDFVLCTEVLEHTLNPFAAVQEIYRLLRPGGLALITVPFNFRIHGPLPDCWRFTEHGLRVLFDEKLFEISSLEEIVSKKRDLMPIHYKLIAKKLN